MRLFSQAQTTSQARRIPNDTPTQRGCCGSGCQDPLSPLGVLHTGTSRLAFASCICNNVEEPVAWSTWVLGCRVVSKHKTMASGLDGVRSPASHVLGLKQSFLFRRANPIPTLTNEPRMASVPDKSPN
jgi:hypothetical protein